MNTLRSREHGAVSGSLIAIILVSLAAVLLAGLSVYLFLQYNEQKTNVDGKVAVADATARREQQEIDDTNFTKKEKEPNREFVGPDDYGRLTFSYPKTWSVYIAKDTSQSTTYEAYLNPVVVPPISTKQQFATRVLIEDKDFDTVIASYDAKVKKGDLKSSPTSANGVNGTRLDGSFDENRRGAVVIYKLRDKTISVFTDADTFKPDFEELIKTIKFNG
jgi:hypothetical protein